MTTMRQRRTSGTAASRRAGDDRHGDHDAGHDRAGAERVPSGTSPAARAGDERPGHRARVSGATSRRAVPRRGLADRAAPAGVDQAVVDGAVAAALGAPDAGSGVRSVVVMQGGAIVYERYHPSVGPDTVMASYSVAKSFTSAIVGLLVDDGLLDLDEHPPRPEWPPGDPRTAITLRQLLQMSSGLQWDEVHEPRDVGLVMLNSPSAAAIMARQPLEPSRGRRSSTRPAPRRWSPGSPPMPSAGAPPSTTTSTTGCSTRSASRPRRSRRTAAAASSVASGWT